MRFRIEQRFRHPVDDVVATLTDPAFLARMAELPKLGRPELLAREEDGPRLTMQVRYAFAGELSGAVRRVVDPARLTWVEHSVTDRETARTSFRIVPDHYAAMLRCSGAFAVSAAPPGTIRTAEGEVRVTVPLVGARVEGAIISGLEEHAAAEAELVDRWLAARP